MASASSPWSSGPVVIICPRIQGHRLSYTRLLLEGAAQSGRSGIVVAPAHTAASSEYALHISAPGVAHRLRTVETFDDRTLQAVIDEHEHATIIFPDGDDMVFPLARRALVPRTNQMNVLVMRPDGQSHNHARRLAATLAKRALRLVARRRGRVTVFTLASATAARVSRTEVRDPVQFAPDDTLVESYRSRWAAVAPPGTRWFGIVGALTQRKNVGLVAKALAAAPGAGLILAGHAEDGEETVNTWVEPLRAAGMPVVRIDGHLSEAQLDSVIGALDVVVLAHSNEGPSGILGKAAAAGRRVLASGAASLRRDLRQNPSLGLWVPLEVSELTHAASAFARWDRATDVRAYGGEFADRLLNGNRNT